MVYDKIIIGAGLYGLYAALHAAKKNDKVLVLEHDDSPFSRATYVNQARVHMGYHYPRSYSTAIKSAHYFERFIEDFSFCIYNDFKQIYATSSTLSWSNAKQFKKFCMNAGIVCDEIMPSKYFKEGQCDGAFLTREYTYDAQMLKEFFISELAKFHNVEILYRVKIQSILQKQSHFILTTCSNDTYESDYILNTTYASTNQINKLLGCELFKIKYELCEIILCNISDNLKNVGLTVMDGPFFSIMPFGKTGYHSLTSVTFTPHLTCYNSLPIFKCQKLNSDYCTSGQLGNCNYCINKPISAWNYMEKLAKKYIKDEYSFSYVKSLYSIKPILMASEIDDSRPTVVREFLHKPRFISVLSGKINTVYDLDEVLDND